MKTLYSRVVVSSCPLVFADLHLLDDGAFCITAALGPESAHYPVDPASRYRVRRTSVVPSFFSNAVRDLSKKDMIRRPGTMSMYTMDVQVPTDTAGFRSPLARHEGELMFRRQLVNEYGSGFGYEYFCSPVEGSEPVHVIVDHDDDSDPYGDVWNQTRVHG